MSERRRVTAHLAGQLINNLIAQPRSREELASAVGLSAVTTSTWIREFKHARLVRICRWDNDSRGYPTIAVFEWAPGKDDCVKPVLTPAQRQAARRAAMREAQS